MTTAPPTINAISAIIDGVEERLARFYDFDPGAHARDHLVTRQGLLDTLGPAARSLPEWQARAGVWLSSGETETSDEMFIGIHFADELLARLAAHDPREALHEGNLDAFCVLVEEISHFHLIVNRARSTRTVTRLELEWQGEIDKLVVCSLTLAEQAGDAHLLPLARRLYDAAAIEEHADAELYREATRHAARFWFEALCGTTLLTEDVRDRLRLAYQATWSSKLEHIERLRQRRSA